MIKIENCCIGNKDMYKWIGSILIIAACSGLGFSKSRELQRHLDELEELKKLFYLLRSEMQYTKAPFAEIFDKIGRKTEEPYRAWLMSLSKRLNKKGTGTFWEIWSVSINEDLKKSNLKVDELEELTNVGKNLAYMESFDLYIEQLEYKIKHTREAYQSKKRLCQSMGIMGGVFLVILLL